MAGTDESTSFGDIKLYVTWLLVSSAFVVILPFFLGVFFTVTLSASTVMILQSLIETGPFSDIGLLGPRLTYLARTTREYAVKACAVFGVMVLYLLLWPAFILAVVIMFGLRKPYVLLASMCLRAFRLVQSSWRKTLRRLQSFARTIQSSLLWLPGYQTARTSLSDYAWGMFNSPMADKMANRVTRIAASLRHALGSTFSILCLLLSVGTHAEDDNHKGILGIMLFIMPLSFLGPIFSMIYQASPQVSFTLSDIKKVSEQNASVYEESLARKSDSDAEMMRILKLLPGTWLDPIRCSLSVVDLGDPGLPPFEALSYVWGPFDQGQTIEVDGKPFRVSNSLYQALLHLRYEHTPRTLWIDALAINQNDMEERRTQVLLMAQQYTQASRVIVWLGESAPWGHRHALSTKRPAQGNANVKGDGVHYGIAHVMASLLHRPWWTRVWVVQELVLARQVQIQCGQTTVDWEHFCLLAEASTKLAFFPGAATYINQFRSLRSIRNTRHAERKALQMATRKPTSQLVLGHNPAVEQSPDGAKTQQEVEKTDLLSLVYNLRSRSSTDPRDKVFAFLGLASDAQLVSPDYARRESFLSIDFARQYIHHYRTLAVVALAESARQTTPQRPDSTNDNMEAYVPSWCPAFMNTEAVSAGLRWQPLWTGLPGSNVGHGFAASGGLPISIPEARNTAIPSASELNIKDLHGLRVQVVANIKSTVGNDGRLNGVNEMVAQTRAQLSQYTLLSKWRQMAEKAFRDHQNDEGARGDSLTCEQLFHLTLTAGRFSACPPPHHHTHGEYLKARDDACGGRRLFVTSDGHLGLGPENLRAGDELHVMLGMQVPVVLRRIEDKAYTGFIAEEEWRHYVGQAYIRELAVYQGDLEEDIESGRVLLEEKVLL